MVKVLLVYDKPFWSDVKFFGVESLNPTGLPLFFVNLHKVHKMPALLASISSQGAVEADKMSENELIKRGIKKKSSFWQFSGIKFLSFST